MWQAVYCTEISLSADVAYWVMDPGTGGELSQLHYHENLLQGDAFISTGDLIGIFYPMYEFQFLGESITATLVASGFESASYSLIVFGGYGAYDAPAGLHSAHSAIGWQNIRDADTPPGGSVSQ
jgi:hypothetical protein